MGKNKKVTFTDADEPYLLKIDMDWIPPKDWIEGYEMFIKNFLHDKFLNIDSFTKYASPSHNGIHFIIKVDNVLSDDIKCYYQFLLGDDRKRCRMNWQSIQLGMQDWNKLYISNRYKKID